MKGGGKLTRVTMYTDGSARGNPNGPGGYGTVIEFQKSDGELLVKELSQGYVKTTNNRMEIRGVLETLKFFKKPVKIKIYSDSQYVINSIVNKHVYKWFEDKDFSKKNLDL